MRFFPSPLTLLSVFPILMSMSLLNFLVTSETRKELLRLLWVDNLEASGYQLARLAGGAYSSVYDELEAMKKERLVTSRRQGNSVMFRKNDGYTWRKALTTLLNTQQVSVARAKKPTDDEVRLSLSKFGAPLRVHRESELDLPLEETLVCALTLARRDATVARVLPVVFAKNQDLLNLRRLEFLARKQGVLPVLGLFLDLTALLTKRQKLHAEARRFKDGRRKRMENFFVDRKFTRFEKELAEKNTPSVARHWHFLMNMGLDSFEDRFKKSFPEGEPA